jgi:hypothetical protein
MCLGYSDGRWETILALFVVVNELTVQEVGEGSCFISLLWESPY